MFETMLARIREQSVEYIFKVQAPACRRLRRSDRVRPAGALDGAVRPRPSPPRLPSAGGNGKKGSLLKKAAARGRARRRHRARRHPEDRPQRSLLLRLGEEVQEVSRRVTAPTIHADQSPAARALALSSPVGSRPRRRRRPGPLPSQAGRLRAGLGRPGAALLRPVEELAPRGFLPRLAFRRGLPRRRVLLDLSTCRFADVPVAVGLIAWALLAAFQGLAWGVAGWLGRVATERLPGGLKALGWAVAWTAVAAACARWTPRLPGDLLEYTQWRYLRLIRSPLSPGRMGSASSSPGSTPRSRRRGTVAGGTAAREERDVGLAAQPGRRRGRRGLRRRGLGAAALRPGETRHVELLQPDVDQYRKWDDRFESDIMADFAGLLTDPSRRRGSPI